MMNKKSNVAILVTLLTASSGCAAKISSNCISSPASLLGWWNGSFASSTSVPSLASTFRLPGTASGISLLSGTGQSNYSPSQAFSFSGDGSTISIPTTGVTLPANSISVTARVKGPGAKYSSNWVTSVTNEKRLSSDLSFSQFTRFDTANVLSGNAGGAYYSGTHDGRYVYMTQWASASASESFLQYDTTLSITSSSSWKYYNVQSQNSGATGYSGAIQVGGYVYFIPHNGGTTGVFARYDTSQAFTSSSAWTYFDLTTLNSNAKGYMGAGFDGTYIYFTSESNSIFAQYNTQESFTSSSSWTLFDLSTISSEYNFDGALFDGRYIYMTRNNSVAQYDTTKPLKSSSSWQFLDIRTVGSGQAAYEGMTFDGRYIYFSPRSGYVNRFDTQGSFTSSSSWSSFNVSTLNALATSYRDAAFDGQYVYFSHTAVAGVIARYDTNQSLTSSNAWSFATLNPINQESPNLGGFTGTLFDGQNMYFVPFNGGVSAGPLWRSFAGYVVAQYDTLGSNAGFSLMSSSGFQSMRGSSNLGPRFQIKTSNGYFSATSKTLLDSSWHYLVGTYDGSTINLYIDGSLAATAPATGTLNSNSNSASIGNFASTTGSANGLINDAQVYSSALSSSQIQALYSSTLCQ